jgi:large subunit ribosomal protein L5
MSTLHDKYKNEVVKKMRDSGRYSNVMEIPRVTKIVINASVNTSVDRDTLKLVAEDLARITGQKALITKAKVSISNFKLREGMPLGAKVTLRGERMYEFMERLISAAMPRIRDFRGVSRKSFDGRGNYMLGLKEHTIFPEIEPDQVKRIQGMDIAFVTTAKTDEEARELLASLGMPFENLEAKK